MKIFIFAATTIAAISAIEASKEASLHLRIHTESSCTITNESQCDGQNWSFSTCCADSSYECRWDDYGQNVKRCQKKHWANHKGHEKGGCTITNESQCNGQNWTGSTCCADSNYECRWDDYGQNVQRCQKKHWAKHHHKDEETEGDGDDIESYDDDTMDDSEGSGVCVVYSAEYAECKPETLPSGELCGQDDDTNMWLYDYCPSGETCEPNGSDYWCTTSNKEHHHHH
ncbi:hypothetical protein JM18_009663 [Phytophthora kernoviae]|uniref:CBM1 domain-containing protein n=1 Tax=Phytophthora kernoviae TaxID=325452 RepID=A0A921S7Z7_9STRA|nr:hypothetical protein JM18_009663 [Phytophthora kernoviae]